MTPLVGVSSQKVLSVVMSVKTQYFVKVGNNPTMTLDVSAEETVGQLKCRAISRLVQATGRAIDPSNLSMIAKKYRSISGTKPMVDTTQLSEYQLPPETTINILVLAGVS